MRYGGISVTINNYNEVFKNYSRDIREVIRSAILDDTALEPYIDSCRNNPYLLWQIKMSIDEGLDDYWYGEVTCGSILWSLREMNRRGINIKGLMKYLNRSLSENHYKYIIKWYEEGYILDNYKFDILADDLLECFDYGICLGYPMYLFNNGVHFNKSYIMCCLRILSNGYKVDRYLGGDWNIENLELLSRYSRSKYFSKLVDFVSVDITPSVLEELYMCCKVGMPLDDVSSIDCSGVYVYSAIHISKIREAYLNKWNYELLLNTSLTLNEIDVMLDDMKYSSSKRVSGRLRKNLVKSY